MKNRVESKLHLDGFSPLETLPELCQNPQKQLEPADRYDFVNQLRSNIASLIEKDVSFCLFQIVVVVFWVKVELFDPFVPIPLWIA